MNDLDAAAPISPLSQRLIDDMTMRFSRETQRNYIRDVGRFATFMGRSPDTATAEDLRRFRVEQREAGVPAPTMNGTVSALRFFFTHTLDRPDLSRRLVRVTHPGTGPGGRHGLCDRQAGNVLSPTYAHGTVFEETVLAENPPWRPAPGWLRQTINATIIGLIAALSAMLAAIGSIEARDVWSRLF